MALGQFIFALPGHARPLVVVACLVSGIVWVLVVGQFLVLHNFSLSGHASLLPGSGGLVN